MLVKPLNPKLQKYLIKHNLSKKFEKQITLLQENIQYPSLETELLQPKELGLYSFRLDKKYRTIFLFVTEEEIEIIDINNHYS